MTYNPVEPAPDFFAIEDVDEKLRLLDELKRKQRENLAAAEVSFNAYLEGKTPGPVGAEPVPSPTKRRTDEVIRHDTCLNHFL